ncbi:MAG: MotA/TolQ/ExbB proton channel family protein [Ferrovum sp.]|uniref:MotA/TolQ/ExbB proton channel family protein n=1 Tax=Ferrovum sp. TaxID=2609467 RepID=UPI0026126240|nr:MotA/TolQ/ExbB proton channel family protein [Ferrovum sp.]MBW8066213.1 MotA/TolQ/ExbB proton channel family protein [Ferrovum sp.]
MDSGLMAAGWPSFLLLGVSVGALAIIVERFLVLRPKRVLPPGLLEEVLGEIGRSGVTPALVGRLSQGAPLARVLAAGLRNERHAREVMKEAIEEAGRAVVVDMDRAVGLLGTLATVSPLLGLLGTVLGLIVLFRGGASGDMSLLSQGIALALYNTAFGLIVAIPALIFYRFFRGRIERLSSDMEQQAIKLVEVLHGDRQP